MQIPPSHLPKDARGWLVGLVAVTALWGSPSPGQNVNDATRPGTTTLFTPGSGFNLNDLIRAGQQLQDLENRPRPEQQEKALDEAIQRFRQSRPLPIGPNILPTPTPLETPPTP